MVRGILDFPLVVKGSSGGGLPGVLRIIPQDARFLAAPRRFVVVVMADTRNAAYRRKEEPQRIKNGDKQNRARISQRARIAVERTTTAARCAQDPSAHCILF